MCLINEKDCLKLFETQEGLDLRIFGVLRQGDNQNVNAQTKIDTHFRNASNARALRTGSSL